MRKRQIDEIGRQNLAYVVEACGRRVGKARGGQIYLARLLNTPETHLSAIKHGKRNLRELKERIEELLNLADGWMDVAHDETAVAYLEPRIPSRPGSQNTGTPRARAGFVQLPRDTWDDFQRRLSELESRLGSKSSTRK